MKFDMGAAWNEAVRLLAANRQVLLIVAGVFFFLPYVAFTLVFSNEMTALEAAQASNPDPKAMGQAMIGLYGQFWWLLLIMVVLQTIGVLGLLALLSDRTRPTVGEALAIGLKMLLPYFGAQLLMSCLYGLLLLVPIAVGVGVSVAAGALLGIVALVAFIYLFTKFLMVPPVIAIERVVNPLAAMGRSWRLTKGNSIRLFLFVFLLFVAVVVVGGVLGMVIGLALALAGPEVALVGNALVSGLVNAAFYTVFLAVLAAVHRQLTGAAPETVSETFS
ncbi:glycerophosphoryl diester phosphodiesterase membrane domain-containing protein [Tsuneonella sp. YG55]|uniref:Glycerophosphoryl diester phosphodiesterase membrane domain-containing protein n=1 Tax=Tsuneonella litorea TaxID=2976475 RepID=A0A9X3A8H1_9SPHN|nr:glycerophosphoryl diester phosphodiesterase membrane domain-containing protein [Tsuneonella litorea]MCT2559471.1 glycerophosphoryl diester phosphodiesterase membrane domain-containing protein [Tsuneonella litorea]